MSEKWKKSPPELVEKFGQLVPEDSRIERRKMFGYPCAFIGGNMFMGLFQADFFLRLAESDRARFLGLDGAKVLEPMPGRPMREYVVAPARLVADPAALRPWIVRSLDYAAALPAKAGRKSKPKAKKRPK